MAVARILRSLALLSVLTAFAMAGCAEGGSVSNGPDGQSAAGGGNLAYNGASNGSHTDTFEGSGTCELQLNANLGSGTVKVTLTSPSGETATGSYSGPGQTSKTYGDATGSEGTWTLKAERSGGFTGQYTASAIC
jgi:hypothetical protein